MSWKPTKSTCKNCDGELEMRPGRSGVGWEIAGNETMEYRHVKRPTTACWKAEPFSNWRKYQEWLKQ